MTTTTREQSTTIDATPGTLSPRQRRAVELLEAGAVAFVIGRDYATVKGSGKATYKVGKAHGGCQCADWTKRGEQVGPCKHQLAVMALTTIARACRTEVKATGRCTLPAVLGKALAAGAAEMAARSARLAEILSDPQDDLFAEQTFDRVIRGTALVIDGEPVRSGLDPLGYCDRCGRDLPGGSRCPAGQHIDSEHDLLSEDLDSDPYEGDRDEMAA